MIPRTIGSKVEAALARQAAVALIGPRQVGKTTLAHEIARTRPSIYLDLEAAADRDKLSDPVLFLDRHVDKLVILDEIEVNHPVSLEPERLPSDNLFLARQALRRILERQLRQPVDLVVNPGQPTAFMRQARAEGQQL